MTQTRPVFSVTERSATDAARTYRATRRHTLRVSRASVPQGPVCLVPDHLLPLRHQQFLVSYLDRAIDSNLIETIVAIVVTPKPKELKNRPAIANNPTMKLSPEAITVSHVQERARFQLVCTASSKTSRPYTSALEEMQNSLTNWNFRYCDRRLIKPTHRVIRLFLTNAILPFEEDPLVVVSNFRPEQVPRLVVVA